MILTLSIGAIHVLETCPSQEGASGKRGKRHGKSHRTLHQATLREATAGEGEEGGEGQVSGACSVRGVEWEGGAAEEQLGSGRRSHRAGCTSRSELYAKTHHELIPVKEQTMYLISVLSNDALGEASLTMIEGASLHLDILHHLNSNRGSVEAYSLTKQFLTLTARCSCGGESTPRYAAWPRITICNVPNCCTSNLLPRAPFPPFSPPYAGNIMRFTHEKLCGRQLLYLL